MSLVTLTTYPSASDESRAVQLIVMVVIVLLMTLIEVGADPGTIKIKKIVIFKILLAQDLAHDK